MNSTIRDMCFDDYFEAYGEYQKRKLLANQNMLTRVEQSPYGGYRVRTIPVSPYFMPLPLTNLYGKKRDPYKLTF